MLDAQEPLSAPEYGRLLAEVLEPAAGYAWSILKHRADAEDAVQQAALRGLERRSQYDRSLSFRAWWFTILRNGCIDIIRSRRHHEPLDQVAARTGEPLPEEPASWSRMARCLERLGPDHEAILRLRYFGDLSYDELGHALDIPKGTVMSRLHYARKALSSLMQETSP